MLNHRQLASHPSLSHTQEINDLCKPLSLFNISTFANARINKNGEFSSLNNNPEFMLHYLDKKYHCADISAKEQLSDIGSYLMWDMATCRGDTEAMLTDAAAFNYRHIFTVIEKNAAHTDFYHFGTHIDNTSMNQWYLNNLDKLRLFIDYFKSKVSQSQELSAAHNFTFPVNQPERCQIDSESNTVRSEEERQFLNQISLHHDTQKPLSIRQYQCIELLLKGYSSKKIAAQLNISCRTVEDHLTAIKSKFKAQNKAELILKAAGLISIP